MIGAGEARAGIWVGLRAAGPEYAMLAAFAAIGTNLLDFATVPAPGDPVGLPFFVAQLARILFVFFVTYAIERKMAGNAAPLRPSLALVRFFAFGIVWAVAYGLLVGGGVRLAGGGDLGLATRWLIIVALIAAWGVLVARLFAFAPALANGATFRSLGQVFRGLRGAAVPIAVAFLQVVLPFAAIHSALALVGVQLPLSGTAFAALAVVDGVVSAVQLLLTSALAVFAWQTAIGRAEGR